jgi:hypothetical protein
LRLWPSREANLRSFSSSLRLGSATTFVEESDVLEVLSVHDVLEGLQVLEV